MNSKLIIAVCAYLTLLSLQLAESEPLQAPNVTKIRVINQQGTISKNNTVFKSFAVSNNGAFSPVTAVLGRHASAHNTIKKKIEDKKRIEKIRVMKSTPTTSLPTICFMSSTSEPSTNEGYDNAAGQVRTNTLFSSRNWGNSK